MKPSVVVFDIGGVLLDWPPHLAWLDELGSLEAVQAFIERVGFAERTPRADCGERFTDLALEIDDAQDRARLVGYVGRFDRTIQTKLDGSWDLLHRLQARDVPLHAITNWSLETWPVGCNLHPELKTAFGVTVVSGEEQIIKPDARIYEILCERAGVQAGDCVFIDDSPKNVTGAKAAGMDAIHFTGAEALEAELIKRGLL